MYSEGKFISTAKQKNSIVPFSAQHRLCSPQASTVFKLFWINLQYMDCKSSNHGQVSNLLRPDLHWTQRKEVDGSFKETNHHLPAMNFSSIKNALVDSNPV